MLLGIFLTSVYICNAAVILRNENDRDSILSAIRDSSVETFGAKSTEKVTWTRLKPILLQDALKMKRKNLGSKQRHSKIASGKFQKSLKKFKDQSSNGIFLKNFSSETFNESQVENTTHQNANPSETLILKRLTETYSDIQEFSEVIDRSNTEDTSASGFQMPETDGIFSKAITLNPDNATDFDRSTFEEQLRLKANENHSSHASILNFEKNEVDSHTAIFNNKSVLERNESEISNRFLNLTIVNFENATDFNGSAFEERFTFEANENGSSIASYLNLESNGTDDGAAIFNNRSVLKRNESDMPNTFSNLTILHFENVTDFDRSAPKERFIFEASENDSSDASILNFESDETDSYTPVFNNRSVLQQNESDMLSTFSNLTVLNFENVTDLDRFVSKERFIFEASENDSSDASILNFESDETDSYTPVFNDGSALESNESELSNTVSNLINKTDFEISVFEVDGPDYTSANNFSDTFILSFSNSTDFPASENLEYIESFDINENQLLSEGGEIAIFHEVPVTGFEFLLDSETAKNALLTTLLTSQGSVIDDNWDYADLTEGFVTSDVETLKFDLNDNCERELNMTAEKSCNLTTNSSTLFKAEELEREMFNLNATDVPNERNISTTDVSLQTASCPKPGSCIFWFLARDECVADGECQGSMKCCKLGCSKKCIDMRIE